MFGIERLLREEEREALASGLPHSHDGTTVAILGSAFSSESLYRRTFQPAFSSWLPFKIFAPFLHTRLPTCHLAGYPGTSTRRTGLHAQCINMREVHPS